jgi:hypothetical protein
MNWTVLLRIGPLEVAVCRLHNSNCNVTKQVGLLVLSVSLTLSYTEASRTLYLLRCCRIKSVSWDEMPSVLGFFVTRRWVRL